VSGTLFHIHRTLARCSIWTQTDSRGMRFSTPSSTTSKSAQPYLVLKHAALALEAYLPLLTSQPWYSATLNLALPSKTLSPVRFDSNASSQTASSRRLQSLLDPKSALQDVVPGMTCEELEYGQDLRVRVGEEVKTAVEYFGDGYGLLALQKALAL
jgi:hypothetical protein